MHTIQKREELRQKFSLIERAEEAERYDVRNRAVLAAVGLASELGYPCGVRIDATQPEWPVMFIQLPNGQVSWHLPQHPQAWDGHDTAEKYRRCREYAGNRPTRDGAGEPDGPADIPCGCGQYWRSQCICN